MPELLSETESVLRLYFNDIAEADTTPLSREREAALAAHIKAGDVQARNALVQANLRYVIEVAKSYQNRSLPLSDLIAAGNLGLMTAAERFDATRGCKFITYAVWWIRQSIQQALAEHVRTVRLPGHKMSLLRSIYRVTERLRQRLEEEPDVEALAAELKLPVQEIKETLRCARPVQSLDEPFEEEDECLLDTLTDAAQEAPDAELLRASDRHQVAAELLRLNQRQHDVLRLYFGLDGNEALTLEQIGRLLGVTRERVRQIREEALDRLRNPSRRQELRAVAEQG